MNVGPVNEIAVVASGNAANASGEKGQLRFEVVGRRESEPADFDAFGNPGAFGAADEVNARLGQSLVVDDREDGSVVVGPFAEADAQGILAATHAVAQEGGAMGRKKGPVVAREDSITWPAVAMKRAPPSVP